MVYPQMLSYAFRLLYQPLLLFPFGKKRWHGNAKVTVVVNKHLRSFASGGQLASTFAKYTVLEHHFGRRVVNKRGFDNSGIAIYQWRFVLHHGFYQRHHKTLIVHL